MARLTLLFVAVACCLAVASAASFTMYSDVICGTAVGDAIRNTPVNSCQPISNGGSVKITCSSAGVKYEEWRTASNLVCAGPATISGATASTNANDCFAISSSLSIRVDCNSASQVAISSLLLAGLAFFAVRVQRLL